MQITATRFSRKGPRRLVSFRGRAGGAILLAVYPPSAFDHGNLESALRATWKRLRKQASHITADIVPSKQSSDWNGREHQRLDRRTPSRCFPCPAKRASVPSVVKTRRSTPIRIFRIEFSKYDNRSKQRISSPKTTTPSGSLPNFQKNRN